MRECFHQGVALYAMARKSKKRKYKTAADRILREIIKWVESENRNVGHYRCFLDAESAVLRKKFIEAENCYKESIVLAARPGYIHGAALFNERYADFNQNSGHKLDGAADEAQYRLQEAIRCYKKSGALKARYSNFWIRQQ